MLAIAALPLLLGLSGGTPSSAGYRFARDAAPYAETVGGWMLQSSLEKTAEAFLVSPASSEQVSAYFRLMARHLSPATAAPASTSPGTGQAVSLLADVSATDAALEGQKAAIEQQIQRQVASTLEAKGVGFRSWGDGPLFPPVLFRFQSLPNLLVVSPRSHIERLATVLLTPDMRRADAEKLEAEVAAQGYSALVTPIGGLGVYPSMVPENSDLRWTTRTVSHEWAHQFFALRPLGWRYAFGAERDERMVMLNETVAEIIGREVGDQVYAEDYGGDVSSGPPVSARDQEYRDSMRETRTAVDALLAAGKVDEAESYMEGARQSLVSRGYSVRKLNQAYFAFNGSYTDELAIGGAVGDDLSARVRLLRNRYTSLGDFVWAISGVGSYDEFLKMTSAGR